MKATLTLPGVALNGPVTVTSCHWPCDRAAFAVNVPATCLPSTVTVNCGSPVPAVRGDAKGQAAGGRGRRRRDRGGGRGEARRVEGHAAVAEHVGDAIDDRSAGVERLGRRERGSSDGQAADIEVAVLVPTAVGIVDEGDADAVRRGAEVTSDDDILPGAVGMRGGGRIGPFEKRAVDRNREKRIAVPAIGGDFEDKRRGHCEARSVSDRPDRIASATLNSAACIPLRFFIPPRKTWLMPDSAPVNRVQTEDAYP